MKKMLFLILFVLIQNTAFSENFGLFKEDWNRVPVNQPVTVYCYVEVSKENPDKNEIKEVIQNYHSQTFEINGRSLGDVRTAESLVDEAFRKYCGSDFSSYSPQSKCDKLTEFMNSCVEVSERKSAQVLIRSISFKFINSEFADWKAALKGEKIRYCAIKVDVDWNDAPLQAEGVLNFIFYDQDGIKISPDYSNTTTFIGISRGNGEAKSVIFSPDRSRGAPVRFEIQ
jgi:hypothetical protein